MKLIEPISSSILITACAYAAGVSHNNSLMRTFGIDPEFSQPSIEKALYDGGIITLEQFYTHIEKTADIATSNLLATITLITALAIITAILYFKKITKPIDIIIKITPYIPIGTIGLLYILFLTTSSFNSAAEKGEMLATKFIKNCQWIEISKDGAIERACAFKKTVSPFGTSRLRQLD